MRATIIISGVVVEAVGIILFIVVSSDPVYFQPAIFTIATGGLNLLLGVLTARSGGVTVPSGRQDTIRMIVDRGVIGSTIYLLAFSDKKLVLKRLTSGTITVLVVVVFAVTGLVLAGFIGAAAGGLTAFSLQEFLTQRRRDVAKKGSLTDSSGTGDLEFPYSDIEKLQLTRSRLRLFLENGIMGIVISRRYPAKMYPVLQKIMPGKIREND